MAKSHLPQCSRHHQTFSGWLGKHCPNLGLKQVCNSLVQTGHQQVPNRYVKQGRAEPPAANSGRGGGKAHLLTFSRSRWCNKTYLGQDNSKTPPTAKPSLFLLLFKQACWHQGMTQPNFTAGPIYIITTISKAAKKDF